jgi:5-methylthioribose kinase
MKPVKLSPEHLKKLVHGIKSLDEDQRALVEQALSELTRQHGEIWPEDLHRSLQHLRAEYKISEIDAKSVVSAIFP